MGSAALALCMSFFIDLSQDFITTKIAELLGNNSYFYGDLDAGEPKKAFHSNFIICLLATIYILLIKDHAYVDGIDTITLSHSSIKRILDPCDTAVFLFFWTE